MQGTWGTQKELGGKWGSSRPHPQRPRVPPASSGPFLSGGLFHNIGVIVLIHLKTLQTRCLLLASWPSCGCPCFSLPIAVLASRNLPQSPHMESSTVREREDSRNGREHSPLGIVQTQRAGRGRTTRGRVLTLPITPRGLGTGSRPATGLSRRVAGGLGPTRDPQGPACPRISHLPPSLSAPRAQNPLD